LYTSSRFLIARKFYKTVKTIHILWRLSPPQETDDTIRVILPFKDQISADIVKKQLKDLNLKVHTTSQSVFLSRKIKQKLNVKETKPPIVNQQCVFCGF